jgi:hypothetical protein
MSSGLFRTFGKACRRRHIGERQQPHLTQRSRRQVSINVFPTFVTVVTFVCHQSADLTSHKGQEGREDKSELTSS